MQAQRSRAACERNVDIGNANERRTQPPRVGMPSDGGSDVYQASVAAWRLS